VFERAPHGAFVVEDYCRCHAAVDRYDDGLTIEYGDPDTGLRITSCPNCGRGLGLLGQKPVASREQTPEAGR
jgi:hypothetical protein